MPNQPTVTAKDAPDVVREAMRVDVEPDVTWGRGGIDDWVWTTSDPEGDPLTTSPDSPDDA
jgi:hypothetical protein